MPVVAVTFPWNATVWPSEVSVMAMVAALTVEANVVPPELVSVTVPILVPMAPLIVATPVVFRVRFEAPDEYPVTDDNEIGVAAPAPTVKVYPVLLNVIAPMVI